MKNRESGELRFRFRPPSPPSGRLRGVEFYPKAVRVPTLTPFDKGLFDVDVALE